MSDPPRRTWLPQGLSEKFPFLSRFSPNAGKAPTSWADAPARMAEGLRVYAIGDVHGEAALLDALLDRIRADAAACAGDGLRPLLVFLGDYVDRGPDSGGVLERLTRGPLENVEARFLAGNHEAAMLDFLAEPTVNARWLDFGGAETLAGYGILSPVGVRDKGRLKALRDRLADRLPAAHERFLKELEVCVTLGDYAFVHAGVKPGRPLKRQRRDDMMWMREPFLSSPARHEKMIVHGHTIVAAPEIHPNRIAVDTGAYATGVLTAVVLAGTERRFIQVGPTPRPAR